MHGNICYSLVISPSPQELRLAYVFYDTGRKANYPGRHSWEVPQPVDLSNNGPPAPQGHQIIEPSPFTSLINLAPTPVPRLSHVQSTPSPLVPRSPPPVNVPNAPGLGFGRFAPHPGSPSTPFHPEVILNPNGLEGPTTTSWIKPEPASPVFSEATSLASGRTSVGPPPTRNNGAAAGTSVRRNNQAPQRPQGEDSVGRGIDETWRDTSSTGMTSQTGMPAERGLYAHLSLFSIPYVQYQVTLLSECPYLFRKVCRGNNTSLHCRILIADLFLSVSHGSSSTGASASAVNRGHFGSKLLGTFEAILHPLTSPTSAGIRSGPINTGIPATRFASSNK